MVYFQAFLAGGVLAIGASRGWGTKGSYRRMVKGVARERKKAVTAIREGKGEEVLLGMKGRKGDEG